jgi:hypothetical protein
MEPYMILGFQVHVPSVNLQFSQIFGATDLMPWRIGMARLGPSIHQT